MPGMPIHKYRPFAPINLPDRHWPGRVIDRAPIWCSVDLRDGNQALVEPMGPDRKRRMFDLLVKLGFKEIEVGFPAASETDFDFVRELVDRGPGTRRRDDPGADPGARRTDRAQLRGDPRRPAGDHAPLQFDLDLAAARRLRPRQGRHHRHRGQRRAADPRPRRADAARREILYQYSPESFTGTELDFAVEICEAVMDVWRPTPEKQDHPQPAGDGRDGDAERLCRPDRMVRPQHSRPRCDRAQPAPAQRPRHRRGGGRAGRHGRRRPRRGHALSATASAPAMSM